MAAAIVLIIAAASLLIPRAGYYLTLRNKDSGELYARYRMDEGDRFSITFKHSVNQYPLTDTFEISEGKIYAEECKYYAYGAGVQVELNPGEELSYTDDGPCSSPAYIRIEPESVMPWPPFTTSF